MYVLNGRHSCFLNRSTTDTWAYKADHSHSRKGEAGALGMERERAGLQPDVS